MSERCKTIKLVHSEYKNLVKVVTSILAMASGYRVDQQSPKDLRNTMIPIYKYLAGHLPDIFKTEEVPHLMLSDFKLLGMDVQRGEVKLSYVYHGDQKQTLHRLTFVHELGPFTKFGKKEDWKVV